MTPKERASENRSLAYQGVKRCSRCDEIQSRENFGSKGRKKGSSFPYCLSCAIVVRKEKRETFDGWLSNIITGCRYRAKKSGLLFDLDRKFLKDIWTGVDYFTGDKVEWNTTSINGTAPDNQASLDKLIPDKGYIKGNVQWVSKKTNVMKYNCTEAELYLFCETVLRERSSV